MIYLSKYTKPYVDYCRANSIQITTNISDLDRRLSRAGAVLDKLDVLYVFSGNGSVGSKIINILNPTLARATSIGGMNWDNTGMSGNGNNAYLDLGNILDGRLPKFQMGNCSYGFIQTNDVTSLTTAVGSGIGGPRLYFVSFAPTNSLRISSGVNLSEQFNAAGSGFKAMTRNNSTNCNVIVRGTNFVGNAAWISFDANQQVTLLRQATAYGTVGMSMFFMGGYLTFEETQTLRSVFETPIPTRKSLSKFNGKTLSIQNTIYLSSMGKRFIEFNLDNGYTLSYNKSSIDSFVTRTRGILEKLDLMYLLLNNASFSTVNLIDPSKYRGSSIGDLNWGLGGVQGNGVNGYIDTNFNPSLFVSGQKYQFWDACRGFIFDKVDVSKLAWQDNVIDGISASGNNSLLFGGNSTNVFLRINTPTSPSSGPIANWNLNYNFSGLRVLNRKNNDNIEYIQDGVSYIGSSLGNAVTNANQLIFQRAGIFGNNNRLSLYFMGASLTLEETQTLRTEFNNLRLANGLTAIA